MRSCVVLGCPPGLTALGALLHLPTQSGLVLWSQPPTFSVYYTQLIEKSSAQLLMGGCHFEAEVIKAVGAVLWEVEMFP